jgi:hypothetical protein
VIEGGKLDRCSHKEIPLPASNMKIMNMNITYRLK